MYCLKCTNNIPEKMFRHNLCQSKNLNKLILSFFFNVAKLHIFRFRLFWQENYLPETDFFLCYFLVHFSLHVKDYKVIFHTSLYNFPFLFRMLFLRLKTNFSTMVVISRTSLVCFYVLFILLPFLKT